METGDGETTLDCVVPDLPAACGDVSPDYDVPNVDREVSNPGSEVVELRLKVEALKQELEECKSELIRLQKQLSHSERLQQSTEGYNEDLRRQVEELSAELHERKKRDKDRLDAETQTDEYVWTDTDYYNYYGGYYQDPAGGGGDAQESLAPPGVEETGVSETTEGGTEASGANGTRAEDTAVTNNTTTTAAAEAPDAEDMYVCEETGAVPAETPEGDGSIADILRATAEQAMTQTGFVFDETTGMYYDHSTGFYYDSVNQLYYDNNTGIYYYYDAESGKYQFHSRIEVQTEAQEKTYNISDWKSRTLKQLKKTQQQLLNEKELANKDSKLEEEVKRVEKLISKKSQESRKPRPRSTSRSRSRSRSPGRRRRDSPKRREERRRRHRDERSRSRSRSRSRGGSRSRERSRERSRRRRRRRSRERRRRQRSEVNGDEVNSEPEEGELTESERESSPSSKGSGRSVSEDKADADTETQNQDVCPVWPPCVRVTVVRSPVLQVGTLFILTADSTATIGREKDMDHAIRISEMGVSKFHAEVYFDAEQQCYMLVDQGSQNGTVLNGNRILQPKTRSVPQPLTHGDEVKMGETVLSFHIHPGTDTCDGCEPGQILAHLSKHKREEPAGAGLSREDKEALRVQELKNMKAKYGLQSNEETKALKNPRYKDRAESRRQTVGSQGVFQRDDAPASVHEEIGEGNKGRKMLEKMGWKKGEGLGKEGTGIKDPVELKIRKSQSGLGAAAAVSVDDPSLNKSKNQKNWEKARERFNETCQTRVLPPTGAQGEPTAWVRGDAEDTSEGQT